jgi:cysteine desulfuration protein SufE
MTIKETVEQIVAEFSFFEDWMDKYNHLIEMGRSLPMIDEKDKTESNLISGCQSRVWLNAEYKDGKIIFRADSDAVITKGIVSLLVRVFSEQTPNSILEADLGFIDTIGLRDHLSPTRSNGLNSMIKQITNFARVFKLKMESE